MKGLWRDAAARGRSYCIVGSESAPLVADRLTVVDCWGLKAEKQEQFGDRASKKAQRPKCREKHTVGRRRTTSKKHPDGGVGRESDTAEGGAPKFNETEVAVPMNVG